MKVKINPIVTYDSGFEMSVLDGVFVVDKPRCARGYGGWNINT